MGQKFFISFNSADQTKAHWIAWILKEAGHEVAVHDWEIPARGNVPRWTNTELAFDDRLIAVISPDYVPSRYSPMEWASEIWNDPDGTKGSVIPVIVRPTSKMPPLLGDLSRIDLTNCSEDEARRRLIKGVDRPAPPELEPAFEKIEGAPPDIQHVGPTDKPTFVQVNVDAGVPRSLKLSGVIVAIVLAVFVAIIVAYSERGLSSSIAGALTGIVMGALAGVALLLLLRPALITAPTPIAPVIPVAPLLTLIILITLTILSLLLIMSCGRWMSTELLRPQNADDFFDCYMLALTIMLLLVIAYPVSQWILKFGRTIAGAPLASP